MVVSSRPEGDRIGVTDNQSRHRSEGLLNSVEDMTGRVELGNVGFDGEVAPPEAVEAVQQVVLAAGVASPVHAAVVCGQVTPGHVPSVFAQAGDYGRGDALASTCAGDNRHRGSVRADRHGVASRR